MRRWKMNRKMFSFLLFDSREKAKNIYFLPLVPLFGDKSREKENVLVKRMYVFFPRAKLFVRKQYLLCKILFLALFLLESRSPSYAL